MVDAWPHFSELLRLSTVDARGTGISGSPTPSVGVHRSLQELVCYKEIQLLASLEYIMYIKMTRNESFVAFKICFTCSTG